MKSERLSTPAIVAFVLLAVLYGARLGAGSLWDNSEPQYGEIVKEMLRGGDWLTLHKDGLAWFIHPPLWFWAAAACAKLFGLSEFSLRLPSALFALASSAAIFVAARRLYGEAAGIVAMLALGTCLEMLVLGRLAVQDTMLVYFMLVAGFWSYFGVRDGDVRAFWIATFAVALGTLVKGPVAAVLPFLSLLAWVAWTKRWRALGAMPWSGAILAYVAVAGAWFAAETTVNGGRFLSAYFGASNVGRFLSPFENQPGPWYFYLPITIVGFFPWIAFVPSAFARAWRSLGDDGRYLIVAFAVPLVFFSAAQTKLPNYIVVGFPPLAVMVGELFSAAISAGTMERVFRPLVALALVWAVLYAAFELVVVRHPTPQVAPYLDGLRELMNAVTEIVLATAIVASGTRRPWIAAWGLSLMTSAFILIAVFGILPKVEATAKPMKAMAADVMRRWHPGERICFDGVKQGFSLDYYTSGPPVKSIGHNTDDTLPATFFADPSPALCVVDARSDAALAKEGFRLTVLERTPSLWLTYRSGAR